MTRGVEQVEHVLAVGELQHGRGDGDAALLLHLHPVRGDSPPLASGLHGAGRLHRAAVEEELLGEGGLARVGVADDGERAPPGGLLGRADRALGIGPVCAWLVPMGALTQAELDHFDEHGFVRLPGFADAATCEAMLDDVIAVTRAQADGTPGARGARAPGGEPRRPGRSARGAGVEGVQAAPPRRVRGLLAPRRRARPRGRPRRAAARLLPLAVHLQEPRRVGSAVAPGQLVLPVRAGPTDHRRLARRHPGHPRERLPPRAAGIPPRAGARARARPAARRELRLRRDRRPRHGRGRSRCSWIRATCCCSTAT